MTTKRQVPYYTTDDPDQWGGHVWRQRQHGQWGFAWEVFPPFADESCASGWRRTQEAAEAAMQRVLEEKKS